MRERIPAVLGDPRFQEWAEGVLRWRGFTSLPAGFNNAGEVVLSYLAQRAPEAVDRIVRAHEEFVPPAPSPQPAPQRQQPQTPQQPASRIDASTMERLTKLFAAEKVAAQAKQMKGSSAFKRYLTPQLEESAAIALKGLGAAIPAGHTAGETFLAGISLMSPADIGAVAEGTRGALGDATDLRRAHSKLTTHRWADAVGVKVKKAEEYDPHRGIEPDEKAKQPTMRDEVAKAYYAQKERDARTPQSAPTPRRVYSKQDLEVQKIKDKFFPDKARPIVLAPDAAREVANEARDRADAGPSVSGDPGTVAGTSGGASDG